MVFRVCHLVRLALHPGLTFYVFFFILEHEAKKEL